MKKSGELSPVKGDALSLHASGANVKFCSMTALAQKLMTAEEFVAWAEARPEKHWELFNGVAVMQQSQSWGHAKAKGRIYVALLNAVSDADLPLSVGIDGIVVKTSSTTAFEPDVVVFSGAMDDRDIIVPAPLIVVEVLSASTARKDLTVKLAGYFQAPSITHYLIVDWEEGEVIHHRREGTGLAPPVILKEGVLRLDPPGLQIALANLFR